ncbi:hypothetical protein QYE76_068228 [Lolium multiflorum]|uniref:Uncharacterized protein n=1 Tax=Lolium multiflorum TaxID=4521 RepID=A0AAD8SF25_LOLMU|nr:hypothetical protein QYE76_068228 [Lolium multiflorum]
MATEDLGNLEWERSKISQQDINMLKKLGITKKQDALRFPKEESYPAPPMQYRVSFVDHLIRGLSTPIHDFLRGLLFMIRVQPLQARKTPWMYAGDKDVDRLSTDLSVKDLEKLVRKISSLNKKDNVPTSCGVTPYSATNALPQGHATASPLPPLPEDGEVEERLLSPTTTGVCLAPESEAVGSRKSAHPLEKDAEAEATSSTRSPPSAASPESKRKRDEAVDTGTSKAGAARAEETVPDARKKALDLYGSCFLSAQKLAEANKRADALAAELEQSETARMKAEADAAAVEDLQKRLDDAKNALSENVAQHSAREEEILSRLESQSRRFVRRTNQEYELESPEGDQLLDALSLLEIHGTEARDGLAEAKIGLSRLFPYFFKKKEEPAIFIDLAKCFSSQEDLGLQLRQEGLKVGVEGTIALVAESQQNVDWARVGNTEEIETKKWQSLIKAAKPNSKKILATLGYKPAPAPSSSKPEVK